MGGLRVTMTRRMRSVVSTRRLAALQEGRRAGRRQAVGFKVMTGQSGRRFFSSPSLAKVVRSSSPPLRPLLRRSWVIVLDDVVPRARTSSAFVRERVASRP